MRIYKWYYLLLFWLMVFNVIFNNIPVYIVAVRFIGGGNQSFRVKPPTCRKTLTNLITWCCIDCTSPWTDFELTLVVIGTDYTGSCQCHYHTITTTTAPCFLYYVLSAISQYNFHINTAAFRTLHYYLYIW